jgi:ubiquinone/menaquinone biosynthesis C-methylase UbiE
MENNEYVSENAIKLVYNTIAKQFDGSRIRIWPCVSNFLKKFSSGDHLIDIGCGNGKNILSRPDLKFKGIDLSDELVKICVNKDLDVIEASMTSIPFDSNLFDGFIAVASYHHLSNDDDRTKTLNEMYRVLKNDGHGLIVVWAMEQPEDSTFKFTKTDELVRWKHNKTGLIYMRYYHIYNNGDLVEEIIRLEPRFKIINFGWEKGNWWIHVKK